jgi:hypothetical protein
MTRLIETLAGPWTTDDQRRLNRFLRDPAMFDRQLQQRQDLGEFRTEWEPVEVPEHIPAALRPSCGKPAEWRALVRHLNQEAKAEGCNFRYRSVPQSAF